MNFTKMLKFPFLKGTKMNMLRRELRRNLLTTFIFFWGDLHRLQLLTLLVERTTKKEQNNGAAGYLGQVKNRT